MTKLIVKGMIYGLYFAGSYLLTEALLNKGEKKK